MKNSVTISAGLPMLTCKVEMRVIDTMALRFMRSAIASKKAFDAVLGHSDAEIMSKEMHASSCLMHTAAALEAFINEAFLERQGPIWRELSSHRNPEEQFYDKCDHPKFLALWVNKKSSIDDLPTLQKYKLAASLLNIDHLIDVEKWAIIELIFFIRNALMHFQPCYGENRMVGRGKHKLRDLISDNFVIGDGDPLTKGCLQSPCLEWAVNSALDFINYLCLSANLGEVKTKLFLALLNDKS